MSLLVITWTQRQENDRGKKTVSEKGGDSLLFCKKSGLFKRDVLIDTTSAHLIISKTY